MNKILIATTNQGKFKEYKLLLSGLPLRVFSLKDLKINKDVKETGKDFNENAILKAKSYSKMSGLPALCDDGGLEIDYLNGEPGVISRRWPGYEANDQELMNLALKKLANVPWQKRKAQLRIVLALAIPPKKIFTSESKIRGFITKNPQRLIPGYPYRAIFYLPRL